MSEADDFVKRNVLGPWWHQLQRPLLSRTERSKRIENAVLRAIAKVRIGGKVLTQKEMAEAVGATAGQIRVVYDRLAKAGVLGHERNKKCPHCGLAKGGRRTIKLSTAKDLSRRLSGS